MAKNSYDTIKTLLASSQPEEMHRGLELVRQELFKEGSGKARSLFEMISAIFYIDPLDQPELVPVLNEAVSLAVDFGEWAIPILLEQLDAGDLKAQMAVSHALGRIGEDAIQPLITDYQASTDPARRMFVLYALGKIKSSKILDAAPLALEAAKSADPELRDTATRAIGKFVESIPPSDLPEDVRNAFIERLRSNLADPNPGIRAKAVRSMGKLAKHDHLDKQELEKLKALCHLIMGTDDNFDWDRAYIVRKEAEEALTYT